LLIHEIGLLTHVPGLSLHPIGLSLNVPASLAEQNGLPTNKDHLQYADYRQDSCKPFEFPLYDEILAALLTTLIASWGGWLLGGKHRIYGGLLAVPSLGLIASILTTASFCDPLFWRAEWRSLTGQEANRCQSAGQTYYRQTFQHNGGTVSQKTLDVMQVPMARLSAWIGFGKISFQRSCTRSLSWQEESR
jgi:hypothetical protein